MVSPSWETTGHKEGINFYALDPVVQSLEIKPFLLGLSGKGSADFYSLQFNDYDFINQWKGTEGIKTKVWPIAYYGPAYHHVQQKGILGMDMTLQDWTEIFLNRSENKLSITAGRRTINAEESEAKGALYASWHSHTFSQTNIFNSFKKEGFNLFKSKGKEVNTMTPPYLLDMRESFFVG